jgi:hypothetical protein
MTAAVLESDRPSFTIQEKHDVLTHQSERFWTILEQLSGDSRIPELPEYVLLRLQHRTTPLLRGVDFGAALLTS